MAITKIQSESLNLADDFAFTGTITGAGESNVPAFSAYVSSNQSLSDRTTTKVNFSGEDYDTASAYDNTTNYRFTVPSGQAGKYFISTGFQGNTSTTTKLHCWIYINGSSAFSSMNTQVTKYSDNDSAISQSRVFDLSVGDYIEVYARQEQGSTSTLQSTGSWFFGFKIT